jgi:hypothetical protein
LLKYCPNLIEWSCSHIGEIRGLEESVTDCDTQRINLQKLKFDLCALTRNAIMAVADLSNLKELQLQGSKCQPLPLAKCDYRDAFQQGNLVNLKVLTLKRCDNLDKEGLTALLKSSSTLQSVTLHSLPTVSGFSEIIEECNLEQLETFTIINCPGFLYSDKDVFSRNCPKMKEIVHETHDT